MLLNNETEMNTCDLCPKQFKTLPALKGHKTRFHTIAEIKQAVEEVPEINHSADEIETTKIAHEIICDLFQSIGENSTEITSIANEQEFSEDISFEISETETENEYIGHNIETDSDKIEVPEYNCVQTQTEIQAETIVEKFVPSLKINGVIIPEVNKSLKALPEKCDDIKIFNGRLQLLINNETFDISHLPIFRKYDSDAVDPNDRVQPKQQFGYELMSYKQYKYAADTNKSLTYLNMRVDKMGNQLPPLIAKLFNENPKLVMKFKRPQIIYFDLETFDTEDDYLGCPLASRTTSHISMISLVIGNTAVLFHLDKYTLDKRRIGEKLQQHCGKSFEIVTEENENENAMVLKFLMKVEQLSQQNTIVLCGFNSSADPRDSKVLGYDWSFILRCLKSDIKLETRRCSGTGEFPTQLVQINILPNVYLADFILLCDENTKASKQDIVGGSLNSYLKGYGLPLKMEGNHRKERRAQIQGGDLSEYGAYCLYDSVCLQMIEQKVLIFNSRFEFCERYNLPLSMCLYQTTINILTCRLMMRLFSEGLMFTYSKLSLFEETRQKQGAYTRPAPVELQYLRLIWTIILDFASQYPNAGIQNNISPETFVPKHKLIEGKEYHCVEITYQVGSTLPEDQKIFAHFDKEKTGIVSEFQREIFEDRKAIKKSMKDMDKKSQEWLNAEVKQLALKEQINSMYGAQNDSHSQIYRWECGSSITGFARHCIEFAIQQAQKHFGIKDILFADTDSMAMQVMDKSKEEILKIFETLNAEIGLKYPRMVLELEKFYQVIMYPKNKKSYANIDSADGKLTVKGIPFNCFTMEYRKQIKAFFQQMLTNDKISVEDQCQNYVNEISDDIQRIIQQKDVKALEKYVRVKKLGKAKNKNGVQTDSGYIEQEFPNLDQHHLIPFNCHQKKSFCVRPIEFINEDNVNKIRVLDLIAFLCSPLKTFFKTEVAVNKKYLGQAVPSGFVAIREQSNAYPYENRFLAKIEDLKPLLAKYGNKRAYHEVLTEEINRMYFDIEHPVVKMTAWKLTNYIQSVIQNTTAKIHLADGCKVEKMSYHVVVDVKTNKKVNKQIAELLNAKIGIFGTGEFDKNGKEIMSGVVDCGVYSDNHCMRLPDCCKIEDKKIELRKLKMLQGSTLADFIISDTRGNIPEYIDLISFSKNYPISDAIQFKSSANVTAVKELLKSKGIVYKIDENKITIKNKPYDCPACGNKQRSDNLKIVGDSVLCYDEGCQGIKVQAEKQKPKQKRLEEAVKQTDKLVRYNLAGGHHTFVKSQMGTGKTEQLMKLMPNYRNIFCLSFRRTFADEFSQKAGFVNYQELSKLKEINMSEYPRIIVQLESLHKVNFDVDLDLVIFDEIESILSQVNAFDKKENDVNNQKLYQLLQNKCLFMDALLQQSTIDFIGTLSGIDNVQTFENVAKTMSDRQMFIDENPDDKNILASIKADLLAGKKLSVNCASKKLLDKIYALGKSLDKKCAKYNGDNDLTFEQFGVTQTMGNHKKQQLSKPNEYWNQLDLLIYTSTISAGISFIQKHFNIHYGILKNKSSDVISFIQGNHRVRDLSDNIQKIYLFRIIPRDFLDTPQKIANKNKNFNNRSIYIHNNQVQQLSRFLQARKTCLINNAKELFLLWSESAGYKFKYIDNSKGEKIDAPELIQPMPTTEFIFTEKEFKSLPIQIKANDFSLGHCDEHMNTKKEICRIAGIYEKTFSEIMKIFDTRDQNPSEWDNMIKNQNAKISQNLINTAMQKTSKKKFAEIDFPQIKAELLDYLHHTNMLKSQITTNLNIMSDSIKTKYIENIVNGVELHSLIHKYKSEQLAEYIGKVAKQQGTAMTIINGKLAHIGYKIKSESKETKIMVDGKRTSQRTYTFELIKLFE